MTAMEDVTELAECVTQHIQHHQGSLTVRLLWKGYLAGCMMAGVLEPDDYHALNKLTGEDGEVERRELFLGFPGQYEVMEDD